MIQSHKRAVTDKPAAFEGGRAALRMRVEPHVYMLKSLCGFHSMALVPYVENPLPALSKLHNSSAHFRFANRDLHLAQDWKKLGVAAVVWDAVSVSVRLSPVKLLFKSTRIPLFPRQSSCACIWSWARWT